MKIEFLLHDRWVSKLNSIKLNSNQYSIFKFVLNMNILLDIKEIHMYVNCNHFDLKHCHWELEIKLHWAKGKFYKHNLTSWTRSKGTSGEIIMKFKTGTCVDFFRYRNKERKTKTNHNTIHPSRLPLKLNLFTIIPWK